MAHAQKPDLVFQRNGRVHLNRRGCQFSRLLAVEECGSADSNCIDRVPTYSARQLVTHSTRMFPLHFPSRASPCAIRFRTRYTCVRSFGDIARPPRSPDLTVPDLFLCGFLKDRVFRRRIVTIQELKQTIVDEAAAIDEDLRRRVGGNLQTRFQQCIDVNGGHLPDVQKISF